MFTFQIELKLRKKIYKLKKKDPILAEIFLKKIKEVIAHDKKSINTYKNLKSPMHEFKRIHLTDNFILLFQVKERKILFVDILHWDKAYKK